MLETLLAPALLIPVFAAIFGLVALVRPVLRLWIRHRRFGVVTHRAKAPLERLTSWGFYGLAAGIAALATLLPAMGPEALGLWVPPLPARALGAGVLAGATALMVVAQNQMGASWRIGIAHEKTGLVQHGIYAHIRHPIYTGLAAGALGGLMVVPGVLTLVGAAGVVAGVMLQARLEEAHQLATHGEDYRVYAARTGRFLPGVGRLG